MARNRTDYPIYLFNEGTNYEAYEFFKTAYVVKDTKKVWRFRVWAPNAISVSVVGDFNKWNRESDPMTKISASGIWEVYIKGAKRYDIYKFCIECSDHQIRYKSDPYALHTETAPANGSKVYDIAGYKWHDAEYMEKRKSKKHWEAPMNIYEMHLGSWRLRDDGNYYSYKDLAISLVSYLKEMGYTHVEILPITEHPYDGSWGYQSTGLYAPTSRYGTPHDFMYFVDKCHEQGISVIMDFVVSHFPKDEFGLYEFDGTCLYEYMDSYKQEHKGWGTRVFDYNKPQVRSFLVSAIDFWLKYYHIDGMRLDAVASMLYLNYDRKDGDWQPNEFGGEYNLEAIYFLQTLNKTILTRHPDTVMIAEESTAFPMVTMPSSAGGLGFNYKWNMGWMNDTLSYIKLDPFFRKGSHNKLTFGISYAFNENFILPFSHDEVVHGKSSMIGKIPGSYEEKFSGLKTVLSYQIAHPGKKLNFMGNEFGQFIEWNYRKQLDWLLLDYNNHRLFRNFVKDLNFFYMENEPMYQLDSSYEGFKWVVVDDSIQNILVFNRYDKEKNMIICIMNFANQNRDNYEFGVEKAGEYIEILNSDCIAYGGTTEYGIKHETIKKNNHNYENSLCMTIKGNSAIFLKKA
ncbi:MAG TPA: 1,4-alpha-glucan branching protein GlgB [Clostridia bacterium]|nr:1,4-alpha-glucan branching protein GlgB [Clostridia bacterium]